MTDVVVDVLSRRGFFRLAAGAALASPLVFGARAARADMASLPTDTVSVPADTVSVPVETSNGCIDVSGRWTCGTWRSFCTGHHGRLKGVLVRNCNGDYDCRFSGTFAKIVPFLYRVTLNVVECRDGVVYFRGSKRLPLLGTFCYHGHATCCSFQFNYTTKKDRGVFQMSR
jgi:hypothetical protein